MNKQSEYQNRYDKVNTKSFIMKLHIENDADIIEKLDTVDNRQGYIKSLIRADLNR